MKAIRAINEFFLADADEEIAVSEYCWFYIPYALIGLMVIIVAFS